MKESTIKEFIIDWDKIARNVREALEEHERKQMVEQAPYHPGYEGAVVDKPVTAGDLRSMADKLFKEAQALRRKADEIEPVQPLIHFSAVFLNASPICLICASVGDQAQFSK